MFNVPKSFNKFPIYHFCLIYIFLAPFCFLFLFKNILFIHILNYHMSNFNVTHTCFVLKTNYPSSNKKRAPVLFHLRIWIRSSVRARASLRFYAGFIEIVNFCKSGSSSSSNPLWHTHTLKQYKGSRLLLELQIHDRKAPVGSCRKGMTIQSDKTFRND